MEFFFPILFRIEKYSKKVEEDFRGVRFVEDEKKG